MEQAVVDVTGLSRSFGGKSALEGVSFHATAGQVYGLVGANGAGKTTLLKHLLGLLRAASGAVRVFGLDPVRDPVGVLRRVGYLSEERELLETFALDPAKKVKELSKGMRAQAGLLVAVAHRPELLILDEPSSGLDALVRRGYQRSRVRFLQHFDQTPVLETALAMEGGGRTWSVVHGGSIERFHHSVLALGGEIVESRDASLEEIFLARAGRSREPVEAA